MSNNVENSGIDSFSFIVPEASFLQFLQSRGLRQKVKKITRNNSITRLLQYKYKKQDIAKKLQKHAPEIKYISLVKYNKAISNTIVIRKFTKELNEKCRKEHRKLGYFLEINFNGLHQQTRRIHRETMLILRDFLKRFKVNTIDLAIDFLKEKGLSKKEFSEACDCLYKNVIVLEDSIYANIDNEGVKKIIFYDKFKKQTQHNKQKLVESVSSWKRLEISFNLRMRFKSFLLAKEKFYDCADNILTKLTDDLPFGAVRTFFDKQSAYLTDARRRWRDKALFLA